MGSLGPDEWFWALHREIVDRNPLDGVEKRAVGGKETERDRILTHEEITALAKAVPAARMGAMKTMPTMKAWSAR